MDTLRDLPYEECLRLLVGEAVGRIAICTPDGPHVVPVNYVVDEESIVFRTAPYSVVGSNADGARLALEVDALEPESMTGWSVLATGAGAMLSDTFDIARVRMHGGPSPWAGGLRPMHIRLTWHTLTGRRVG